MADGEAESGLSGRCSETDGDDDDGGDEGEGDCALSLLGIMGDLCPGLLWLSSAASVLERGGR